ncbi:anaerobic ribonucleoside-triphosphate reductase activating protein [Candidatus Pacearchaeota archaeon]|nr:MAG: anaerobic ribonucleoside-triphosphate reductase activating protein [Candidatus Pacearchaeota archaeon]
MQIGNFLKESFIDYPEKISSIVFSPGCNFRCPACYAKHLLRKGQNINEADFFSYLNSRKGWIEGVVLCGGEPTLQKDLADFARKIKDTGLNVKLDTNGSNPLILEELKQKNLIDYVAMDIKGPEYLYSLITGRKENLTKNIEKAMIIVPQFPDYEFRTTIVPINRNNGNFDFMTTEEVVDIAKWLIEITKSNKYRYYLQPFVPKKGQLINPEYEKFPETPINLLKEIQKEIVKYLPNCEIR